MSYEVDDDVYPATAVVLITSRWGTSVSSGSGFLVGTNDVLTAAHVIYDGALGGLADEIRIYPSYDPDDRANSFFNAVWVEYYKDFDPNSDGFIQIGDFYRSTYAGSEIDIALLSLDTDLGTKYGYFGIDPSFLGGSVGVIGYPGVYGRQPTFDSGTVGRSNIDNVYLINSDLEVNPGNSGGPIYYDYGSSPYAVGIVSTRGAATSLASHYSWLADSISANNRFLAGYVPVASYNITSEQSSVNEGEIATFFLSTTNLAAFTSLTYQIRGLQAEDIQDGGLSGTVLVGQNGRATIAIPIKRDLLTEGDETLQITIESAIASVVVRDTSKVVNYPSGDTYAGDVINGQLQGLGTLTFADGAKYVGNFAGGKYHGEGTYTFASGDKYVGDFRDGAFHGEGTFYYLAANQWKGDKYVGEFADNQRNGEGTYTFANGVIWSGQWRDSELMPPVYALRSLSNSIDEGKTAQFDLVVTNYKSDTLVSYTLTGLQAADIVGGELRGSAILDARGTAKILIPISADGLIEGFETLTVSVQEQNASVTINDTSNTSVRSTLSSEFTATSGNDVFQGSRDKIDVVKQAGNLINFSVQKIGTTLLLTDNAASGGMDTLVDIERVMFSDKALAFDVDGATSAGGIYRLYKATFNREPDTNGLGYWIGEVDLETKDAVRMAEDFTWSQEFQDLYDITTVDNYGTGTDIRALVSGFYQNVLGRTPDEGGLNFYTGVIESKDRSVGRVLAEISDSQENYDGTIALIANGIVFDPWVG